MVVLFLFTAGDIGGLCGVFIGFSLISIAEMGYFVVRIVYLAIKNRHRNRTRMNRTQNFHFYK